MRRLLIAIALIASFSAQLVLSGASAACAMPSTGEMAAEAGPDAAMAAMTMPSSQERQHDSRAPLGEKGSCDTQLPTAVCQLMSACTAPAATMGTAIVAALPQPASDAIPFLRSSPPLRATAPELPPPRA